MPGGGFTGVIVAGGAQPAGAVGNVPICTPAVTPDPAAGAAVAPGAAVAAGAVAAVGCVVPLAQAAPNIDIAATSGITGIRRFIRVPLNGFDGR